MVRNQVWRIQEHDAIKQSPTLIRARTDGRELLYQGAADLSPIASCEGCFESRHDYLSPKLGGPLSVVWYR